ncbi:ice-binding family protein [Micromonospora sp. NPDC050187]|uniref:ice-binding family protein n=1 Tax=Micromonospora sp. NPDC050187 TaxID=3364277 RepID=UPI00379C6F5D
MTVTSIRHRRLRLRRRAVLPALAAVTAGCAAVAVLIFSGTGANAAVAPVGLGTAADFSVLAGSTATNTGPSFLGQSLGVHPGDTAPGFLPIMVGGEIHLGDAVALQAKDDLTDAYNDAAGRTPFTNLPAELGGSTLLPGVYRIGAAQLTGTLTLNSQGDPAAVFIFQIDSTLITAANSSVVFINGASPCNVYWQVSSSATLGTGTRFVGNILAQTSITMRTGATLQGRALAQTGAVTLDTNVITAPVCLQPTDGPTGQPTGGPTGQPTGGPTGQPTGGPTGQPTGGPTGQPTGGPTGMPAPSRTALPVTGVSGGGALVPLLTALGSVAVATGAALLLLYRRRTSES